MLNVPRIDQCTDESLTDQKIDNTAEDNRGECAQSHIGQDLREEVHRHSVVAADVLVPVTRQTQ